MHTPIKSNKSGGVAFGYLDELFKKNCLIVGVYGSIAAFNHIHPDLTIPLKKSNQKGLL
jgi:hypothetical protein